MYHYSVYDNEIINELYAYIKGVEFITCCLLYYCRSRVELRCRAAAAASMQIPEGNR